MCRNRVCIDVADVDGSGGSLIGGGGGRNGFPPLPEEHETAATASINMSDFAQSAVFFIVSLLNVWYLFSFIILWA